MAKRKKAVSYETTYETAFFCGAFLELMLLY